MSDYQQDKNYQQDKKQLDGYKLGSYYSFKVCQSEDRVSIGAFNGFVQLSVWRKGDNRPINITLNRNMIELLKNTFKNIIKAQPNTTLTFEIKKFDNSDKRNIKYTKDIFIKIIKDEKQKFFMEISSQQIKDPIRIRFMGPGGYAVGTDDLTEAERSLNDLQVVINILEKEVPLMFLLATFNKQTKKFEGNNNRSSSSDRGAP